MNVNEISFIAGSKGLDSSSLDALSTKHPSLQDTEIHVSSVAGHLTLELFTPRSHIRSEVAPHDLLERRGLTGIIEWTYLKKVVLAESSLVIYPLPGHGRKTTLRLFKGHVVHQSLF